jgi:hypothetical protein
MGMADLSNALEYAAADLLAQDSPRLDLPHAARELASLMDGSWAAQLQEQAALSRELTELADAIRLAAKRYAEADQAF